MFDLPSLYSKLEELGVEHKPFSQLSKKEITSLCTAVVECTDKDELSRSHIPKPWERHISDLNSKVVCGLCHLWIPFYYQCQKDNKKREWSEPGCDQWREHTK